jgi:hypothetical protein
MIRILLVASWAFIFVPAAQAQNCRQYPPGPERRQCAVANNPAFAAKLERCKDEARGMGLSASKGDPAIREYVQSCMHRR